MCVLRSLVRAQAELLSAHSLLGSVVNKSRNLRCSVSAFRLVNEPGNAADDTVPLRRSDSSAVSDGGKLIVIGRQTDVAAPLAATGAPIPRGASGSHEEVSGGTRSAPYAGNGVKGAR